MITVAISCLIVMSSIVLPIDFAKSQEVYASEDDRTVDSIERTRDIQNIENSDIYPMAQSIQSFINDSRWANGVWWGGSQGPKVSAWNSASCCAYCADYVKYCYGSDNPWGYGTAFYSVSEIQAGDVILLGDGDNGTGHWFVVVSRNGNRLTTAEGNYSSYVRIGENYTISGSRFAEDARSFTVGYHYPAVIDNDQNPVGCWDFCEARDGQLYVQGWAFDPDDSSVSLKINVYVDNVLLRQLSANHESDDVNAAYGISGNHRYAEYLDIDSAGTHYITIYAINSADNGKHNVCLSHTPKVEGEPVRVEIQLPNKPTNPTISYTHKNIFVGDSVIFEFSADYAKKYTAKLDKEGKGRLLTYDCGNREYHTVTFEEVGTYTFFVTCSNAAGSVDTDKITIRVIEEFPAPQNVRAVATSATSVKISWDSVEGVTGYQVSYFDNPTATRSTVAGITNETSMVVENLKTGNTYEFIVNSRKLVDGEWFYSWRSEGVFISPKATPTPTRNPTPTKKPTATATPTPTVARPAAPANVKAASVSSTSVKVSWNAVSNAAGYEVYRCGTKNGTYVLLGSVTATSRNCPGLTTGKTYYFKVRSYKMVNGKKVYSAYSAIVSATPKLSAPTGAKAASASGTAINVSWNAVTGATGYEVYRSTAKSGTYVLLGSVTATSRKCPGLTTGTTYYFKVRAYKTVNGNKVYSAYSSIVSTAPKLSTPTNVKAVSTSVTSIKVSWAAVEGAAGYDVFRSTSKDSSFVLLGSVTATSRNCPGLTTGKTYYFKVRAYKTVNGNKVYSAYSTVVSAVPKPATPSNMKAVSASATSIKLTWNAVTGATGYEVYRSTSKNGPFDYLCWVSENIKVSTALKTGTTYFYKVRAFKTVNGKKIYGNYSTVVSAVPKA